MSTRFRLGKLEGSLLEVPDGDYPNAILSLDCEVEVGFEIANGQLRCLLWKNPTDEAIITDLGRVEVILEEYGRRQSEA